MNKRLSPEYQRKVGEMVQREVHYYVSSLVHILSKGSYTFGSDLQALCDQAQELYCSVPDYEEAAMSEGWRMRLISTDPNEYYNINSKAERVADSWQELCEIENIEPYEWEIYEHWIVSGWLADRLESKGHRVDRDFAGLVVWGRPTTGQAIAMDDVICQIYDEGPGKYDQENAA